MRYTLKRDDIPLLSQWIKKFDKSKLVEFFGRSAGTNPLNQEKHGRLTRLEHVVILPVFLLLRLPLSATGGGRLRHLVPHIGSLRKEIEGSNPVLKISRKNKNPPIPKGIRGFLVGVTGFEPTTSWSRTKRTTKLCHTPIDYF